MHWGVHRYNYLLVSFHLARNDTLSDDNNNASVIIAEETDNSINLINELKEIMKDIQFKLESVKNKQEQSLLQIQETINVILAKINNDQYHREDITIKDNKIGKYLPLNSIPLKISSS